MLAAPIGRWEYRYSGDKGTRPATLSGFRLCEIFTSWFVAIRIVYSTLMGVAGFKTGSSPPTTRILLVQMINCMPALFQLVPVE